MADAHKNFAYSTVLTAPSPASSGTSLVVQSGDGTKFPAVSFNATVWPAGAQPTTANAEIVRVTAISTDTFTITRTQESSSARTIVVGDQITAGITAKTLTDVELGDPVTVAHGGTGAATLTGLVKGSGTSAMTAVTAPSGAVVGDTDSQTLTNKTLTSPVVNTPSGLWVPQFAVATADQTLTSSSTTLQNLTGLTFNLRGTSTDIWFYEIYLIWVMANTTMDGKAAFAAVPSGATGSIYGQNSGGIGLGVGTWGPQVAGTTPATDTNSLTTAVVFGSAANVRFGCSFSGHIFDGGSSGAMQFQAAQNTSDAGAITLKKGSFMQYTRIN